ncbi:MAG: shikimate kinase [Clostridiales bacterium]|nr:shikimate kinase [Clostridiales bacterium]
MRKHIFLIGFMGVGKSTVSRKLRDRMKAQEIDMDAAIVREAGMPVSEIFERYGEAHFRDLETQMLQKIADGSPAVVSCGGGCVLRPENVAIMKESGTIVLLTADPATIYYRVRNSKARPILNGHMNVEYIAGLMEQRRPAYEGACDIRVSTDGKRPDRIAGEILERINEDKLL